MSLLDWQEFFWSTIRANILLLEVRAILPPSAYLTESARKESQSRLPKAPEGLGLDGGSSRATVNQAEKGHDFYPLNIAKSQ